MKTIGDTGLPAGILEQHIAVMGKTGSGKSSTMRLLVEWLLDQGKPVCIIDPKGDWWGLKSSASGKKSGYPIVIFGGEHGDVPLNAHAGAHVAELVATGNRPCIIDLKGWSIGDRTRFFIDFAATLFKHTRGHRYLVIDEVHNFAPQGKVMDPEAGKMLHWANRLASEGRGLGLTLLSASQRPQKVHKDFLTCSETLIAMRVIHPLDRAAVKDWIDGCSDVDKGKEVLASLASMKRGQGWAWSPEIGFGPVCVSFPMFSTYDSFKSHPGDSSAKLKGWATVDLAEVRDKLAAVVEQAKANDPKELKAQIAALKRELADAQKAKPAPAAKEKIVEKPILSAGDIKRLEAAMERGRNAVDAHEAYMEKIRFRIADADKAIDTLNETINKLAFAIKASQSPAPARSETVKHHFTQPKRADHVPGATKKVERQTGLPKGEAAVLTAIAQHGEGVDRQQITILTGYKRSTRDAYLQRLAERGFIEVGLLIKATSEGIAALGDGFEALPTGEALREYWLQRLPQGEAAILRDLIARAPMGMTRDELTERTDYKRSTRDAYIQRLAARYLVTVGDGAVTAAQKLFD